MEPGRAWIVDAFGCEPASLRSPAVLESVFRDVVADLDLRALAETRWHAFPDPGGVTGFLLLTESHLSVHTFPENGFAAFDLYCCRERVEWPWAERLARRLGAARVHVRLIERGRQA